MTSDLAGPAAATGRAALTLPPGGRRPTPGTCRGRHGRTWKPRYALVRHL